MTTSRRRRDLEALRQEEAKFKEKKLKKKENKNFLFVTINMDDVNWFLDSLQLVRRWFDAALHNP